MLHERDTFPKPIRTLINCCTFKHISSKSMECLSNLYSKNVIFPFESIISQSDSAMFSLKTLPTLSNSPFSKASAHMQMCSAPTQNCESALRYTVAATVCAFSFSLDSGCFCALTKKTLCSQISALALG